MGFNSGFKGLNAELYPIWHLLALLGAHHILHFSRIRVKLLYMFRALPAHLQEVYVVTVYMQPAVSSLSAGDCLMLISVGISCLILHVLLYQKAALLVCNFILIFLYWCICLACLALQILMTG